MDKALPQVTQLQGFQPHSKSQPAKLGCSQPIRVPKEDKTVQMRVYQRDRTRLASFSETLNTPNQKDTFSIVLKLADITLRLAQQLEVEPFPVNSLWRYNFMKLKRLIPQIEQRLGLHHVGDRLQPKT